ncbi:hypothetical protein CHLNCDRAFT_136822 [Chlorella variabilis]|uniref:Uncharacterized protein n=1 Tax=Chlorella variabilis TaxID=554065 RepID=E1ZL49_CHLVA|nr:hypothetical protein CHLNCDRAFT_136822 [Chlorella variabilis]EFN53597.1 hypothetical protein CHLNCDRAFT_136822 [Chlorella variabilis]|eukprot:XP_005845699.1 hypothetical protein CHLNCDRAFT_136822 [Chlorella variabilis]
MTSAGSEDEEAPLGREAFRTSSNLPAFTRRREHAIGRVAAVGFAASLVGELLAGIGPITQASSTEAGYLHYETGISYKWLYLALAALTGWGLLGAVLPGSPTYDPQNLRDADKRAVVVVNPLKNPRKFLVQNEVLVGRIAMAGFAGACVLEYLWGGEAPLAHLGLIQPGTQLTSAPWWVGGLVLLFLANGLGLFSALGDRSRDDDAY